jgi:hypothetical protein
MSGRSSDKHPKSVFDPKATSAAQAASDEDEHLSGGKMSY